MTRNTFMQRIYISMFASFFVINAFAQSTIDEIFTTLTPDNMMGFYVVDSSIYGVDSNNAVVRKYDKVWNLEEMHDAHQDTYDAFYNQNASVGYQYNSSLQKYETTGWKDNEPFYLERNRYSFYMVNTTEFLQGKENILYYIKMTNQQFLSRHTVSKFTNVWNGLEDEVSSTTNSYTTLITDFEFVDWDGTLVQRIILPYYVSTASAQFINVEDKSYIVISAYNIYGKDIPQDWELHSAEEYNIEDNEIEPDVFHHFIYEYERNTDVLTLVRTQTSKKDSNNQPMRIFDINGTQIHEQRSGVNVIQYNDGSARQIVKIQ